MDFANDLIALATGVVALVSAIAATWQNIKARRARAAFDNAHDALVSVATGLEIASRMHPTSDAIRTAKTYTKGVAERFGVEKSTLAPAVQQVVGQIDKIFAAERGFDPTIPSNLARAARPAASGRERAPDPIDVKRYGGVL